MSGGRNAANCGSLQVQEIFPRIGERSDGGRLRLTWSVVVVLIVDGPGRVAVGLTVHGQVAVAGAGDAVLSSDRVVVDAAVGGQLGEGAHRPV